MSKFVDSLDLRVVSGSGAPNIHLRVTGYAASYRIWASNTEAIQSGMGEDRWEFMLPRGTGDDIDCIY